MTFRIIHFVGLSLLCVFITPFVYIPVAFLYAARYFAIELIPLAFLIDVYFGSVSSLPLYTISAFLLIMSFETGKQYLMLK